MRTALHIVIGVILITLLYLATNWTQAASLPAPPTRILPEPTAGVEIGHKPAKPKPQKSTKALTGWAYYRHLARHEADRQRATGLRVWSVDLALLCIRRESGGCIRATNGRYRGLFQIDEAFAAGRWDLLDPRVNFHVAADLYGRRGWQPWSTMRGN